MIKRITDKLNEAADKLNNPSIVSGTMEHTSVRLLRQISISLRLGLIVGTVCAIRYLGWL